jgi:hypothetical protein
LERKGRRIYDVVLHFHLQDGIVRVGRDNTDAEVVRELLNSLPDEKIGEAQDFVLFCKLATDAKQMLMKVMLGLMKTYAM